MFEEFWILPCLENPFGYVVYREPNKEILVEIRKGEIVEEQEDLTHFERVYFEKNILTKSNI